MTIDYLKYTSATITPLGISCRSVHGCGSWTLLLRVTIYCFPTLAACIATSKTIRATLRGGGFHLFSNLFLPSSEFRVCSVFSNWVIPRTMATTCHVWKIYWTSIDQLKRGFACLTLGFLLVYVFREKYYYPSGVTSLNYFICTHTYHTCIYIYF